MKQVQTFGLRDWHDPRRRLFGLILLLAGLMAGLCLVSGSMLLDMRREAWKEAVISSRNVVVSEATNIQQFMRIYDASLRSAMRALTDPSVIAAAPSLRQKAMFDRVQDATFLGPIRILDAQGRVMADSVELAPPPASPAELRALARHRGATDTGPMIGLPVTMHDGGHLVTLSRRITRPDGGFGGMVCGTIRLGFLTDRFRHLRLGPHDVVSLFVGDGVMLAHAPGDPQVGRRITGSEIMRRFNEQDSGIAVAPTPIDGIRRVFSFNHIEGWPLLLDVGVSISDLYAPWRRKALSIGMLLGMMTAAGSILVLILSREVTSRIAAEADAKQNEERYRALADGASDIILRFGPNLVRTYASPSVTTFGYMPDELVGHTPGEWIYPEDQDRFGAMIEAVRAGHRTDAISYRVRRKDGSYNWVEARYSLLEDGELLAILRDVDERKHVEFELDAARQELTRLSTIDPLTGVGNRRTLDQALERELRRTERDNGELAMLLIDVDHFKSFNDHYGHLAGDEALRVVGRALTIAARRPADLAARYGGEEFALVLPSTELFGAISVAEVLREAVMRAQVPHAASATGFLTVSIGVASVRPCQQPLGPAALIARADEALYAAKHAGRNTVRALPVEQSMAE
ncbi:MAG: sensor domain-containing diguanylate cyclase [Janthinobacterium lividum]